MVQEFLSIPGQFQKPLLQPASLDERSAALAVPVDNLFVSQHRLVFGAPVDRSGLAFGQAVFEELQEDPLRPAIVAWVGGVDFVRPIEAVANALQLVLSKALDIARSEYAGVNAALDRKVFTVDAKGVEAYWLENIVSLHGHPAPVNIRADVRVHIAHVQALGRGIGKHHEIVIRMPGMGQVGLVEFLSLPAFPPFRLKGREIVAWRAYFGERRFRWVRGFNAF